MTLYNPFFLQGIEWIHIEYFNNSVICDLIEKVSFWYNDNLGYFRWRKLNTIYNMHGHIFCMSECNIDWVSLCVNAFPIYMLYFKLPWDDNFRDIWYLCYTYNYSMSKWLCFRSCTFGLQLFNKHDKDHERSLEKKTHLKYLKLCFLSSPSNWET